jgi:hypothetical protein
MNMGLDVLRDANIAWCTKPSEISHIANFKRFDVEQGLFYNNGDVSNFQKVHLCHLRNFGYFPNESF